MGTQWHLAAQPVEGACSIRILSRLLVRKLHRKRSLPVEWAVFRLGAAVAFANACVSPILQASADRSRDTDMKENAIHASARAECPMLTPGLPIS